MRNRYSPLLFEYGKIEGFKGSRVRGVKEDGQVCRVESVFMCSISIECRFKKQLVLAHVTT